MGSIPRSPSPPLNPVAVSEELAPLPPQKIAGNTDINFDGQLSKPLLLREDVRTGCGGQTWPAGMVLGKHMLRYHRKKLQTSKILELGAGGGLVGLAVAAACSPESKMLITDQLEMLELLQHNIKLNKVQDCATGMILNWGEPLPQEVIDQKPDVILAAECVYFEPAFPLLTQTLKDLLELNPDAVIYFCFKKRRRADMQFVKTAKKTFLVEEIFDQDRPVFSRQSLYLFTFRRKVSKTVVNANGHSTTGRSNGTVRNGNSNGNGNAHGGVGRDGTRTNGNGVVGNGVQ